MEKYNEIIYTEKKMDNFGDTKFLDNSIEMKYALDNYIEFVNIMSNCYEYFILIFII